MTKVSQNPSPEHPYTFRLIRPEDNDPLRQLIIRVVLEYNCLGSEYLSNDTELANLFGRFNQPGHCYWIITDNATQTLAGGGGYSPLAGSTPGKHCCEIQKMYLSLNHRGKGLGKKLMDYLLHYAKADGYGTAYLETMPALKEAIHLYKQYGFQEQPCRSGHTGHDSCTIFMSYSLTTPVAALENLNRSSA